MENQYREVLRPMIFDVFFKTEDNDGSYKMLVLYRYISLFITSAYYMACMPYFPLRLKVGVVASLFLASLITSGLYKKYSHAPDALKAVLLVEVLGTAALLIPTGGMDSPFIWYALNPVLAAAGLLPSHLCWIGLSVYLSFATFASAVLRKGEGREVLMIMEENSQLYLVFFLITLAVQLLSGLTKRLKAQTVELKLQSSELMDINAKLEQSNERYRDLLEHIMALYQSVEAFTSQDSTEALARSITDYAAKLTRTDTAFFRVLDGECRPGLFTAGNERLTPEVIEAIDKRAHIGRAQGRPRRLRIRGKDFLIAPVKTPDRFLGILGIDLKSCDGSFPEEQHQRQLDFLSKLSAIILERFHFEDVSDRLMIVEEQNRIANEIHDGVSQRLFGIVCAIHTLIQKRMDLTGDQLTDQLTAIMDSAGRATRELRSAIFKLSSAKAGRREFSSSIKAYVSDLARLNDIEIGFELDGDEDRLDVSQKKALYRIVSEAAGNAVRHGNAARYTFPLR